MAFDGNPKSDRDFKESAAKFTGNQVSGRIYGMSG
jgi:hypothetical protein